MYTLDVRKAKGNTDSISGTCYTHVKDRTFVLDLICQLIMKINVILGIYWFSTNFVYIGYKEKSIFIPKGSATPKEVISTLL